MLRASLRTLLSVSPEYQRGAAAQGYEVVAMENGSSDSVSAGEVENIAPKFRYHRRETTSVSSVEAVNRGVELVWRGLVQSFLRGQE